MTTATASLRQPSSFLAWFADFLRKEIEPYPGRGTIVARMTISATITMILVMAFRMPNGAVGPLYAFIVSRENLLSTLRSAWIIFLTFGGGAVAIIVGARLFASDPLAHFLWLAASLFLAFFLLRTASNFSMAAGLVSIGSAALTIWYLPGPAAQNVELTLWAAFVPILGSFVTVAVEFVFHAFCPQDELLNGLLRRWKAIETLLQSYADNEPTPPETAQTLAQLAMVGTGALRRRLTRSDYDPQDRMQMMAVVSITSRSVEFAAAIDRQRNNIQPEDRLRIRNLAVHVAEIQKCLQSQSKPAPWDTPRKSTSTSHLFPELEKMIALIPQVFAGAASLEAYVLPEQPQPKARRSYFIEDAFQNPSHLRYALGGCLASMLCYIFYSLLAWPGISTSIVTCLFTALSDVGSSRQKQILRFSGALLGIALSLGAQICLLPYIDSLVGFTLLFALITAVTAWIAASSPRLSYCGMQAAFAFYLVNFNGFSAQTSLVVVRDRACGVLLGIFMMWLVFDRYRAQSPTQRMLNVFIHNLHSLANLTVFQASQQNPPSIIQIRRLRDRIYHNFSTVNAQADAVPFEMGALREAHLAAQQKVHRWQAQLRTFYLLEMPLLQFRIYGAQAETSEAFLRIKGEFQQACADALNAMADTLASQLSQEPRPLPLTQRMERSLSSIVEEMRARNEYRDPALLYLTNSIASLLEELHDDIHASLLFETAQDQ